MLAAPISRPSVALLGVGGVGLFSLTLAAHVLSGVAALLAGLVAMVTRKGGPRHIRAGRVYVATMGVVVVTALPLAVWADNWFLIAIAVFSGYLVAAGYRVVRRRRAGTTGLTPADGGLHGVMVVVAAGMVTAGATGAVVLGPVLVVFGVIGGILAVQELRRLGQPSAERTPWVNRHVFFIGGGYIATVTAAVTVNLGMLPVLVQWLGPTLIGLPLIFLAVRHYQPRLG
jgi:uncharacterized membrane protein